MLEEDTQLQPLTYTPVYTNLPVDTDQTWILSPEVVS